MRETDGRKLRHDVLEAIRIRAVRRIEEGESPEVVIKALGMNRRTIYKWIAKYRELGIEVSCDVNPGHQSPYAAKPFM